jgi:hypothetical protein
LGELVFILLSSVSPRLGWHPRSRGPALGPGIIGDDPGVYRSNDYLNRLLNF